jgi:hypothetical protein
VTTCVLTGVGAEYPLAGLASWLTRNAAVRCVEVDMATQALEERYQPGADDSVLVTSCHPFLDGKAYHDFYGVDAPVRSVPEQLAFLRPRRACFVPHDLAEPLKDDELPFVPLFDALLMPDDTWWWLAAYAEVHNCGWIKAAERAPGERSGVVFLPSEIGYYAARGGDVFVERFAPVLRHRPRIKLPVFARSAVIEQALVARGFDVLPAERSTGELIAGAALVVSNALSSVLVEAARAGVPALCLADGVVPVHAQRAAMNRFASVRVVSVEEAGEALERGALPPGAERRIQPFDFELATRVILAG